MFFLDWADSFFDTFLGWIPSIFTAILDILFLFLCQLVYPVISLLFNVFNQIANAVLLEEGLLQALTSRIMLVFTIAMTFYVAFEFVKYTVSPDKIMDKEQGAGGLVKRIVIAIILLAFINPIFEKGLQLQSIILSDNVIGRIVMGNVPGADANNWKVKGAEFSGSLFGAFIRVDCHGLSDDACDDAEDYKDTIVDQAKNSGLFVKAVGLNFMPGVEVSGLLALIVGLFVVYVMFLYCKDIAVRQIQLMFLQIISPIAIISYIAPKKDGIFQKWVKACTTTYLDVFIRTAILYFMFLAIEICGNRFLGSGSHEDNVIVYVFLVIGLMIFMKKLPKLLQEFFPSGGAASIGFGFKGEDRKSILGDAFGVAKRVAARGAGSIAGGSRMIKGRKNLLSDTAKNAKGFKGRMNRLATYANAFGRSVASGYKAGKEGKIGDAIKAGQEKVQTYESIVAAGGTVLGHDYRPGHYQNVNAAIQVKLDLIKAMKDAKSNVNGAVGEIKFRKQMDSIASTIQTSGNAKAKLEWDGSIKAYEKLARQYADGKISQTDYTTKVTKLVTDFNARSYKDSAGKDISIDLTNTQIKDNLELNDPSKYTTIKRNISEAKEVAQAFANAGITYDKVEINPATGMYETKYVIDPATGAPKLDPVTGEPIAEQVTITYDETTFAEKIGDYADKADAAKVSIESSKKTKMAKTNADGKK